jgi:hypothetical protein
MAQRGKSHWPKVSEFVSGQARIPAQRVCLPSPIVTTLYKYALSLQHIIMTSVDQSKGTTWTKPQLWELPPLSPLAIFQNLNEKASPSLPSQAWVPIPACPQAKQHPGSSSHPPLHLFLSLSGGIYPCVDGKHRSVQTCLSCCYVRWVSETRLDPEPQTLVSQDSDCHPERLDGQGLWHHPIPCIDEKI